MKAIERCFPMVLFIMLHRVDQLLSLWTKSSYCSVIQVKATEHLILSCVAVYHAVNGGSNF